MDEDDSQDELINRSSSHSKGKRAALWPISGGSAEEISDTESMSSTRRPATSRPRIRTIGPTRAIARTQQSERVRANVNRHRITQARTSQIDRKVVTPRGRIANNLGIVKDKKSSSLPTVYRPVENTLSSMRADIGAASLSIYGDPFDLDPFVDQ
ncbi:hypothetical protein GOODEAATRI_020394 [Goodea atripinnis]|uniref:Uncharacterized protein n=1 Tax=Goodea atripinnis TaxID=208336 RepID=A0ABV0PZL5_9TELE